MSNEQMCVNYHYALTELFNDALHGRTPDSAPDIDDHILCSYTFEPEEIISKEYEEVSELMMGTYHAIEPHLHESPHPVIKNYSALINRPQYYQLQFVSAQELPTGEYVATIKTGLIVRLQRRWKNKLKERQRIIRLRATPSALNTRQITGKWPEHLRRLP